MGLTALLLGLLKHPLQKRIADKKIRQKGHFLEISTLKFSKTQTFKTRTNLRNKDGMATLQIAFYQLHFLLFVCLVCVHCTHIFFTTHKQYWCDANDRNNASRNIAVGCHYTGAL